MFQRILLLALLCVLVLVLAGCQTTPPAYNAPIKQVNVGKLIDDCTALPQITLQDTASEEAFLKWFGIFVEAHERCAADKRALVNALEKAGIIAR